MKKTFSLIFIVTSFFGSTLLADNSNLEALQSPQELQAEIILEDLGLDASSLDQLSSQQLLDLEVLSRRPPRRGEPPRRVRPRPPRYNPPRHRPRPRPVRAFQCVAVNYINGYRYFARARNVWRAEDKALRKCFRNSYYRSDCQVRGCRRIR